MKYKTTKDATEYINVLVYGRSGVGKTKLIATLKNPFIISTESGLLSLSHENIPYIQVNSIEELYQAYDLCRKKKILSKFDVVCLDSISDILETMLADYFRRYKDKRQAYGELNTVGNEIISKFRDLPISTYFIAKADVYQNAAGLTATRAAAPTKKLCVDMPHKFDEVFYMGQTETEDDDDVCVRYIQTTLSNTVDAKDRSGKLNKYEKPNLGKILKKLRRK